MTIYNTELSIKFAIIMTRSKKLSQNFMHPNSNNIGLKIFIAYIRLIKSSSEGRKEESLNTFALNESYARLFE